jgi:hypothetical protein
MEEERGHMTESYWWDSLQFEETGSIFTPEEEMTLLAQPAEIITYVDSGGVTQTDEFNPTFVPDENKYIVEVPVDINDPGAGTVDVEVQGKKSWTPDDVLIAVDRANSDVAPLPFNDPVEDNIISGGSGS